MAIATSRSPSEAPALTIVGSPSDGRVSEFQKALARRGWGPAQILEYTALADSPHCRPLEGVVRLESPGRDPEVLEVIYRLGIGRHESEGGAPLRGRPLSEALADRGRITSPRQFFLGLVEAMSRIAVRASAAFMNHPDEVALAFDKPRCQTVLAEKGIPVPTHLGPLDSYEHLRDLMVTEREPRVFVKLDHGSAASGVVAFETKGDREQAWTTAEIVHVGSETRLYNNRRIRRYRDRKDTRDLVDALCKHGAYAERWLAKASVDGRSSDLRVIVTGGEPTHFVLRSSRGPFTNLHLQGERRDADLLKRCMSAESWRALIDTSQRVAQTFPRTISLGLDIAVSRDLRKHGVLEVNAFGDYVKNMFAGGRTPHDAQLEALCSNTAQLFGVLFDLDGTLVDADRARRDPGEILRTMQSDPAVVNAVDRIAARYRVGIVSDGDSSRQRAKLTASELSPLLPVVVISGEVRAQKPSPKIFEHALRAIGCSRRSTLLVGDDLLRDIAGAQAAGLWTCWISHGRPLPRSAAAPDLIVRTVTDLPEVLAC